MSSGEGTELPHWADPPTGEVPRALAGTNERDDEMQAWRLLGSRGLHWRDDVNDWDDGPGVEELLSADGPVPEHGGHTEGPYSFDADFERLEQARPRRGQWRAPHEGIHVVDSQPASGLQDEEVAGGRAAEGGSVPDGQALTSPGTMKLPPPPAGPAGLGASLGRSAATGRGARRLGGRTAKDGRGARGTRDNQKGQSANVSRSNVKVMVPEATGAVAVGDVADQARVAPDAGGATAAATGQPATRNRHRPYDVTAEGGMSRGGRDVGAAVTTGLAMAVLFVFCYIIGPPALLALASIALLGCAFEVFSMLQRAGFRPATLVGAVGTVGAVLAAYWKGPSSIGVVVVVVAAASLVWYLAKVVEARPVVNAAVTTFAFAWVGVMGSFAGVLLAMPSGAKLFAGAVVPTVVADMAAWFAGSRFGSHRMAPSVSPGKTWEGFAAGAVAAVVVGALLGSALHPWGTARGLVLGVMIAVVAPLGDLVQSMVKRDLRLKDSGALLPGHGGLLDRFDSVLFVLPATYFLVTVLHVA